MLRPGQDICGYRIEGMLGAGGMAMVYTARHPTLPKRVAVKVLAPQFSHDERVVRRFEQEAYIQYELRHPNIVRVENIVQVEGMLAIIMDLVDGPSLDQVINEERPGPWLLSETMRVMGPVLEAMAYAHARKVVHRDLKPANVLLERGRGAGWPGTPRIGDFGIAKIQAESGTGHTRVNSTMGSPPYTAPEQFSNAKDSDTRSDVYALGMLLWRLLAGRLPVDEGDMLQVLGLYKGEVAVPLLHTLRPDVPPGLSQTIHAALSVQRDQRPDHAGELLNALRLWLSHPAPSRIPEPMGTAHRVQASPPEAAPPRYPDEPPARSRSAAPLVAGAGAVVLIGGGVALLAVVGLALFFVQPEPEPEVLVPRSLTPLDAYASSHRTEVSGGKTFEHNPSRALDGDQYWAWCEDAPAYGIGESLTVEFACMRWLSHIGIHPGHYNRSQSWVGNGRIKSADITVTSGGRTMARKRATFEDVRDLEQRVDFDVECSGQASVRIEIVDVYPGTYRETDTCIGDVFAYGQ